MSSTAPHASPQSTPPALAQTLCTPAQGCSFPHARRPESVDQSTHSDIPATAESPRPLVPSAKLRIKGPLNSDARHQAHVTKKSEPQIQKLPKISQTNSRAERL